MTTQRSCSDRKKLDFELNGKYLLGELKRSWPKMVLYFIILVLTTVLPLLMMDITKLQFSPGGHRTYEEALLIKSNRILSSMIDYTPILAELSMLIAVFAGCYVTKILNNKVSADFYHSTPLRRENIFLTRVINGIISFLIPFSISISIVALMCIATPHAEGFAFAVFIQILKNIGYALLAFFMIFSVTVFAGMLCGTTVMQLIITAYLCFVTFVYYASVFLTLEKFTNIFDATWYLENDSAIKLLPFFRFFANEGIKAISGAELWFYGIGSLLLLVGALALYKFRRIEKAGTPIVFGGFATFFRYSVIIPTTLLGGLFFKLLVGTDIWYYIGLIIATVLCFMLLNTIIEKNARKMFSGIKGLAIYIVAMAVVIMLVAFDTFGIDSYVPNVNNIRSVNVTLRNDIREITFKDEGVINAVAELDKNRQSSVENSGSDDVVIFEKTETVEVEGVDYTHTVYSTNKRKTYFMKIVYTTDLGIPIARKLYVTANGNEFKDLIKAVADSEEYEENIRSLLKQVDLNGYSDIDRDFIGRQDQYIDGKLNYSLMRDYLDVDLNYEFFQRQQIGNIFFSGRKTNSYNYFNLTLPAFIDTSNSDLFRNGLDIDGYYSSLAEKINQIVIYKGSASDYNETYPDTFIVKDKEKITEILRNVSSLSYEESLFVSTEPEYSVGIEYELQEKQVASYFSTSFLEGRVPQFVADMYNIKE